MYAQQEAERKRLARVRSDEDKLRINRFKKRKERQLAKVAHKALKGLEWDQAVSVLTGAVSEAIWREGGTRADALATAELVFHAICRDLHALFEGASKVIPLKRNKDYFKKKARDV
jgi:hypothetical protein